MGKLWQIIAVWLAAVSFCQAGSVVNDGSLGSAAVMHSGNIFTIGPASGKQVGRNLFYSLSTLNLDSGETADFTGPSNVSNVLARVTGGVSTIDGTLECDIPNANFFLIDSGGIVFGPDSALNVSGSFTVTTADQVKLADGQVFAALPAATDATLTTAAPATFGFLSNSPAALAVNGSTLSVANGQSVTIAAGNVTMNGAQIQAPAGQIAVASVASPGTVNLSSTGNPISVSGFASMGAFNLSNNSTISTDGNGGGQVFLRAGELQVQDSNITAQTTGSANGIGIDISLTGDMTLGNSNISVNTSGSGNGGDLTVQADSISITGSTTGFTGPGGALGLLAESANAGSGGAAGNIRVVAGSLQLLLGAQINSSTYGLGNGGNSTVEVAGEAVISGADPVDDISGIYADSNPAGVFSTASAPGGNAGNISFSAGSLRVLGGASISSDTYSLGNSGNVTVQVTGLTRLSGEDDLGDDAGIYASTNSDGEGGNSGTVTVRSGSLQVLGGATIDTVSLNSGDGGDVIVNVAGLAMLSGEDSEGQRSGVFSNAEGGSPGGNAGGITFTASALQVLDAGSISSETFGAGNGGNITVNVAGLALLSGADSLGSDSGIYANTEGGGGAAGGITLAAGSLQVLGGAEVGTATFGLGNGGDITIHVPGPILLSGTDINGAGSGVYASTQANGAGGNAGNLSIEAGSLFMSAGGEISSSSADTGLAGAVAVAISGQTTVESGSQIQVFASQSNGGSITLQNGGGIDLSRATVSAQAAGNGGNIDLESDGLFVIQNSTITAMAGANGGAITLDPPLVVLEGSTIDGLSGGSPVNVQITAPLLEQNSQILTDTDQTFPQVNIAGTFTSLPPIPFANQIGIEPTCEHEAGTNMSSFIVTSHGGLPPSPGGWLLIDGESETGN